MSAQSTGELVLLLVCMVLAAAASAVETALSSVGRLRVRHLAEEGSKPALVLQRLQQNPNRFLSTVLVTNTLALILASSAATLLGQTFLPARFGLLGDLGVSLLLSIVLLIFAEVTPKTLAIRNAERLALLAAGPVDRLAGFLRPALWFITLMVRAITGDRAARGPYLTEQELLTILHVSEEQGVIEEEERDMIHGIIEIGDKAVREVMVPRTDMTALAVEASIDDIINVTREHAHTRIPIYDGDLDHMIGLIHSKDILMYLALPSEGPFDIHRMLRPIRHVPESKRVDELLHEMQTKKVHMMVVVDEYGGTAGLVTLEDLLEEIVGEIRDEYDVAEEEPLRILSANEALVVAGFSMEELNERLGLGIGESEEYDSVGGYLQFMLGEIPAAGRVWEQKQLRWLVQAVDGQRIEEIKVTSELPWPDEVLLDAGLTPPSRDGAAAGGATS